MACQLGWGTTMRRYVMGNRSSVMRLTCPHPRGHHQSQVADACPPPPPLLLLFPQFPDYTAQRTGWMTNSRI